MLVKNLKIQSYLGVILLFGITACGGGGGGSDPDPDPQPQNRAPVISGTPAVEAQAGASYSFTPQASDADGDTLTFSISNQPSWTSFQSTTGELSGTPAESDVADYNDIQISVSDGTANASLAAFSITVVGTKVNLELQPWSDFAPKENLEEDEGSEVVDETVNPIVEVLEDEDGKLKTCTTEEVDFFKTPAEYVMFSPPTDVLWPGALVQGKSLRDGTTAGQILPLNIDQRTMIEVSIPACTITNNFREVQPTLANVNSAVASILAEAETLGANCLQASGNLEVETFRNEQQRALKAGMSGKYFGFSASASGSTDKTKTENSVAAIFRESLYTVQVQAPQTPEGWFSDEFTQAEYDRQVELGRMGNDNLPAYVATITYGRILTSTLTSTHSEADMQFAMQFKFDNRVSSVSGDAATRSKEIRQESKMSIAYKGGSAEATAAMLKSEDWTQYFDIPATATDAVPISFQIKSISDDSPAVTQELTSYERVTCFDKVADDATFVFQDKQTFTPSFTGTGQIVALGDVDGNGADDIVWANTDSNGRGEFAVAFANGDGTFQPLVESNNSVVSGLTGELSLNIIDIDNDGREDVVINVLKNAAGESNKVFVSFYKGENDPAFIHNKGQVIFDGSGADTYTLLTYQLDNQHGIDLAWNNTPTSTSLNRTYVSHAVDMTAAEFDFENDDLFINRPLLDRAGNFSGYEYVFVGDVDGDNFGDLIFQNIDSNANNVYVSYGNENGLTVPFKLRNFGGNWGTYSALVGDLDADGKSDLIEPRQRSPFSNFGAYVAHGNSNRTTPYQQHSFKLYNDSEGPEATIKELLGDPSAINPEMILADVDGNGGSDLLINDKGIVDSLTNKIGVGLAIVSDTGFNFARVAQEHFAKENWSQYKLLKGDFNCDKRDDVIWIDNAASNSIYVGIARGEGDGCSN